MQARKAELFLSKGISFIKKKSVLKQTQSKPKQSIRENFHWEFKVFGFVIKSCICDFFYACIYSSLQQICAIIWAATLLCFCCFCWSRLGQAKQRAPQHAQFTPGSYTGQWKGDGDCGVCNLMTISPESLSFAILHVWKAVFMVLPSGDSSPGGNPAAAITQDSSFWSWCLQGGSPSSVTLGELILTVTLVLLPCLIICPWVCHLLGKGSS